MPSFSISDKNWAIDTISKITSGPPPIFRYIPVYHHFRGVRTFFLKLRQSLNFCPRSKKKASNCSEEQSPSIQIPKILVSTTLGGELVYFHINNFLGVSWKLTGSPLPLMWWIPIFLVSAYKGIDLSNNLLPSVWKSKKKKIYYFKLPYPPYLCVCAVWSLVRQLERHL